MMLATWGTLTLGSTSALLGLVRCYRTIPVTSTRRVVEIPPIGSFLVEGTGDGIRLHVTASSHREIEDLMAQLDAEAAHVRSGGVRLDWAITRQVAVTA
jgi:hypothetical protein